MKRFIDRDGDVGQRILSAYRARLEAADSALLRDDVTANQLWRQVRAIVGDVIDRHDQSATLSAQPNPAAERQNALEIGSDRAARGIHPIESLRAASYLFETALPVLLEDVPAGDTATATEVSVALHEAIMRRVAFASLSYVGFLKGKLQASRHDERLRIARELHDRVGHGMGIALQHLDMHRYYAETGQGEPAGARLTSAVTSLGDALRTLQQISAQLRRSIGKDGIERALRAYLASSVPPSIEVRLRSAGEINSLPLDVSEELFLILREATRNAVRHGDPTGLWLEIDMSDSLLRASVRDNGCGFHVDGSFDGCQGLSSMAERAELLNGKLETASEIGEGTTVTVWVPLGLGL